ncbi:hypothetical protein [Haloplasma contractile]|uniref:Uncharacterized protein n=1 Tax=Haloplasma contractile SSD-17B TaxID=1033810 RepID=U2EF49_9MOLU|nr:hypothetical protein [Haloplasma contractile]ERJ13311.1 hypothetical protein HLPCO_000940 [Haloplasma contractile SSD-17B]
MQKNEIIKGKKYINRLKKKRNQLWIPSNSTLIKLILFFVIICAVSLVKEIPQVNVANTNYYIPNIKLPIIKGKSTVYQNLIAVTAGLGAVSIGLAFFVAQSLMDKDDPERGKVLLYKSKFSLLLTSQIAIFIILMVGLLFKYLNVIIILEIILLGLATIYSIGHVIEILIRSSALEKEKLNVFFVILKSNYIKL